MKWARRLAVVVGVLFVAAQLVPYGRAHTNPPVVAEPTWSSADVRVLARRACFDCHSNESHWPWYSNVAPVSWLVQRDVDEARATLNFSEWHLPQEEADEAAEAVLEKEMPLPIYLLLHAEAKLSDAERTQLANGLRAMFGEKNENENENESDNERERRRTGGED